MTRKELFIIICLFVMIFFGLAIYYSDASAQSEYDYTRPSYTDPRKVDAYNFDGDKKGDLQQDPIDPRRTIQRDDDGNIEGYWRKSYIDPRVNEYIPKGDD